MNNENAQSNIKLGLNFEPELNFVVEFELSRNGMIKEIQTEFDIVRLCMTQANELGTGYMKMIDRILVMPLRKLLCEKNSILLRVLPSFKMSPLTGDVLEVNDKLKITNPSLSVKSVDNWLPLIDWVQRDIAYFDRTINDVPDMFPESHYNYILNKLKKAEKQDFESLFHREEVDYKGEATVVYVRISPNRDGSNLKIFNYLNQIGYNHLSIYNFIKHQSDKRGAHIDVGHSPCVELINQPVNELLTITLCIALQLIYAAKIQIPELSDYWPEMPALEVEF